MYTVVRIMLRRSEGRSSSSHSAAVSRSILNCSAALSTSCSGDAVPSKEKMEQVKVSPFSQVAFFFSPFAKALAAPFLNSYTPPKAC